MQVDVVVTGDRETAALIDRLSMRLTDGRPALRGIVDLLLGAERDRFAGRGVRWKRLAPHTLRIHAEHGAGSQPMILTTALMRSLTERDAPGQIVRVSPTTLTFGTRVRYAALASGKKGHHAPRRPLVGVSRAQRRSIVAQLQHLLLEDR